MADKDQSSQAEPEKAPPKPAKGFTNSTEIRAGETGQTTERKKRP